MHQVDAREAYMHPSTSSNIPMRQPEYCEVPKVTIQAAELEETQRKIRRNMSEEDFSLPTEHDNRGRKIRVRTVKVQGPVTNMNGTMQPTSERLANVSEDIVKTKARAEETTEEKVVSSQTDVTYKYWLKNPRYEKWNKA